MRMAMLTAVVLLLAPTAARSQTTTDWANKLFSKKAEVVTHDFGSVAHGAQLYHSFEMTNVWAVPIEIMKTPCRVSCGCVTAKAKKTVLQPRESTTLEVTMDARRFTGPKTVSIYVDIGPQYVNTATVKVSANSRADVVFNPGEVNLGVVERGQKPAQTIEVEYAGVLDWRVSEVVKNDAPVDVKLEEWYRRPGNVGYKITATLKADAPPGPLKQELLLKTNDPSSPLVPVLVEAVVQAPLSVLPDSWNFGSVAVGGTASKKIIVKANKAFKIVSIAGLGEGLQADFPAAAGLAQVVSLKYDPTRAGDVKRKLVIKTDLDGQAPVTFKVEGTVTGP
jgi:hypothetical protein